MLHLFSCVDYVYVGSDHPSVQAEACGNHPGNANEVLFVQVSVWSFYYFLKTKWLVVGRLGSMNKIQRHWKCNVVGMAEQISKKHMQTPGDHVVEMLQT